jgi:rare lipoprotein A
VQTGKCTYYANKFHGRHTSSGDHYDKNLYTAAHRKLPFNTFVKVTNTNNNKSVIVRINDRGPFSKTLTIDVSRVAAQDLDIIYAGVAPCKIEIVENPTREDSLRSYPSSRQISDTIKRKPKTVAKSKKLPSSISDTEKFVIGKYYDNNLKEAAPNGYGIQIGFYKNIDNCISTMKKYSGMYSKSSYFHVETRNGVKHYKLILGQFSGKKAATDFMSEVIKEIQSCLIVNF